MTDDASGESTDGTERIDKFEAKDQLGYCDDAERDHIEEDVVESLDGERYLCFWCEEEVSAYV